MMRLLIVAVTLMSVVGIVAGPAQAQAVDRLVERTLIAESGGSTTADGPPSCVVDSDGNFHVIYSRNNAGETRADLFYRMVSFTYTDGHVTGVSAVGKEVCLTGALGAYDTVTPSQSNSFHMTPRAEIDGNDRVHVVFCGYGRRSASGNEPFNRYNTELAYLNFAAPSTTGYESVDVTVARVLDNTYDAEIDTVTSSGTTDIEFCRSRPSLALADQASGTVIHVACFSASGIDGTSLNQRLTYCRFAVGDDGSVTDPAGDEFPDDLDKVHVEESSGNPYVEAYFHCAVFALGSAQAQILAGFWLGDTVVEGDFHHYVINADKSIPVLASLHGGPSHSFAEFAGGMTSDGILHLVGYSSQQAELQADTKLDASGNLLPGYPKYSEFTGVFPYRNYAAGAGAVGLGGEFFALQDESNVRLVFSGYEYYVSPDMAGRYCLDLATDGTDLFAVYTTGPTNSMELQNDHLTNATDNVFLTVFRKPDPANDRVAWISYPRDGMTVYVPKKDKGKVTLQAVDGAPGNDETYTWTEGEGGPALGSGPSPSLTNAFEDGPHTVTLEVWRGGGVTYATVSFTVQTYNGNSPPSPPSPAITVTPTSGLVTSESGATATFNVVLDTQPTATVTIGLYSDDTGEGTVSETSLVFTTENWDENQTVTVTGVDDEVTDGNTVYAVILAAATSTDTNYNGMNPDDVTVTNADNEGLTTFLHENTTSVPILDEFFVESTLIGGAGTIVSLTITVDITHERPSDLTVLLTGPGGTETIPITSGTYTTKSFTGKGLAGTWTLRVTDGKKKKTGTLTSWKIEGTKEGS